MVEQTQARRQQSVQRKSKVYGILGITKIEDEEGSSAYLYGNDTKGNRHEMLYALFPTLYQDHEVNKRNFYSSMEDKKKVIEDNEKNLERLRRHGS